MAGEPPKPSPHTSTQNGHSALDALSNGTHPLKDKGEDKPKGKDAESQGPKEKKKKEKTASVPLWKLFSKADSLDVLLMILGTLGAMCLGVAMPSLSLLFGQLTNSFGQNAGDPEALVNEVTTVALRFVYVGLGAAVAAYLEVTCWMLTGERQASRLRAMFLKAVLRQEIGYFDKGAGTGEVIGHMSGDILTMQEAMGEKVGAFIRFFCTFVAGFAMAFSSGWLLTLVMLATLPLLAIAGSTMAIVIKRASSKGQEAYAEAGTVVEQSIGAIRTVLAFTGEDKAVSDYNVKLDKAYHAGVKQSLASGLGIGATMMVMFASYALALWCGSRFILEDKGYTGGTVLTVLFSVIIGGMSLGQAAPNLATLAQGQAAAYQIFEVIERKPEINSQDLGGDTPDDVKGALEMRHVSFSYPSRPDVTIFSDFSLMIPAGKSVALVGESGSGKSTVIALVERFYDPLAGEVYLDGRDLRSLQLKWLRQQIALVSQEPVLFHTSIRENISYGREGVIPEEDVFKACQMANIHDFILSLPKGYDTEVGERGTQLSGGQKQRIAIARAIVRNPKVLLLDEATSALDAESEKVVQKALDSIMGGRTTVIVAHRLSTVRKADMIAVMQRGKVVETGRHDTLIGDKDSAYYQLVHLQESHMRGSATNLAALGETAEGAEGAKEEAPFPLSVQPADVGFAGGATALGEAAAAVEGAGFLGADMGAGVSAVSANGAAKGADVDLEKGEASRKGWSVGGKTFSLRRRKSVKGEGEKEEEKEKVKDVPLARVLPLNKPEWPLAIVAVLAAMCQGLMFPTFSILISNIIPVFYIPDPEQLRKEANFWSCMFLVLAVAAFVLLVCQTTLFGIIGSKLIRRVRRLCFAAVLRQEVAWFDQPENSR